MPNAGRIGKIPCREKARTLFLAFLEQKNLRLTAQRHAIIDAVFSTDQHFTAEQLLEMARTRDASVSRATVYRALPLLTESGLVHEMDFGKDYKIYDPNYSDHPKHNHLICEDCDKIVEFDSDKLDRLENEISRKLGFSVKTQQLRITGACKELESQGVCKNKNC